MDKAGFFTRFFAWVIDNVMVLMFSMLIGLVFGVILGITGGWDSSLANLITTTMTLLLVFLLSVFQFIYFGFYWSKNSQSLGMMLMGIKVLRRDGSALSFLRAGLRGTLGYYLSSLIFGLGYLWALLDKDGQTWHDKIFDTWVVRLRY